MTCSSPSVRRRRNINPGFMVVCGKGGGRYAEKDLLPSEGNGDVFEDLRMSDFGFGPLFSSRRSRSEDRMRSLSVPALLVKEGGESPRWRALSSRHRGEERREHVLSKGMEEEERCCYKNERAVRAARSVVVAASATSACLSLQHSLTHIAKVLLNPWEGAALGLSPFSSVALLADVGLMAEFLRSSCSVASLSKSERLRKNLQVLDWTGQLAALLSPLSFLGGGVSSLLLHGGGSMLSAFSSFLVSTFSCGGGAGVGLVYWLLRGKHWRLRWLSLVGASLGSVVGSTVGFCLVTGLGVSSSPGLLLYSGLSALGGTPIVGLAVAGGMAMVSSLVGGGVAAWLWKERGGSLEEDVEANKPALWLQEKIGIGIRKLMG